MPENGLEKNTSHFKNGTIFTEKVATMAILQKP